MDKTFEKLLVEQVSAELGPYGFTYDKKRSGRGTWRFVRSNGPILQMITFDESELHDQVLRVFFETSTDPIGIYGSTLMGEQQEWYSYTDEASFHALLSKLLTLAVEKGLPWYEISARGVPVPPEEINRSLYRDFPHYAEAFVAEHELQGENSVTPQYAAVVEDLIRERQKGREEPDWPFLLGAAAYYAECMRGEAGGDWLWDEDLGKPCLQVRGRYFVEKIYPLFQVAAFWNNPYKKLREHVRRLRALKATDHY